MAFENYETSTSAGQPVELYEVTIGEKVLRYTDGGSPVTYAGEVYEPHPIRRNAHRTQGSLDAREMKIEVPLTSPIADVFRVYPPSVVVALRIRQGHIPSEGDPGEWAEGENFPTAWLGRILEGNRSKAVTTLTCESTGVGLARVGLRRNYQWPCPLVLYGARCRASKSSAETIGQVVSYSGNTLRLEEGWVRQGSSPSHYVGGLVEWESNGVPESRAILRIASSTELKLSGPVPEAPDGGSVRVYLGCAHTLSDCENLHENVRNYGGQPWIPKENPVGKNTHM